MVSNRIAEEHRHRNEVTRAQRHAMTTHRSRVMNLIDSARAGEDSSICIIGAGNGNDIDLSQLASEFRSVTLVDLDHAALDRATRHLNSSAIRVLGGIDVTGVLDQISQWDQSAIDEPLLAAAIELATSTPAPNIGTFDVVCSTCVLSQLVDSVCMAMPADHPRFVELVLAVRNRHLNMIAELLSVGGTGILITDFVSSHTVPELQNMPEDQIANAAMKWVKSRNFFTGVNPFMLRAHYQQDEFATSIAQFKQLTRPWKWDLGVKQFAVCALTIERIAGP